MYIIFILYTVCYISADIKLLHLLLIIYIDISLIIEYLYVIFNMIRKQKL